MKLMSDYSCGLPLWTPDEAVLSGDSGQVSGLSPALIDELIAWQNQFDQHFHYTTGPAGPEGWDDDPAEREYARTGHRLHQRLEAELGEPVELDLWPVRVGWRPARDA